MENGGKPTERPSNPTPPRFSSPCRSPKMSPRRGTNHSASWLHRNGVVLGDLGNPGDLGTCLAWEPGGPLFQVLGTTDEGVRTFPGKVAMAEGKQNGLDSSRFLRAAHEGSVEGLRPMLVPQIPQATISRDKFHSKEKFPVVTTCTSVSTLPLEKTQPGVPQSTLRFKKFQGPSRNKHVVAAIILSSCCLAQAHPHTGPK